jgi:hypothetical protein
MELVFNSLHLKYGLIRGVTFGWSVLIREVTFDWSGLMRGGLWL